MKHAGKSIGWITCMAAAVSMTMSFAPAAGQRTPPTSTPGLCPDGTYRRLCPTPAPSAQACPDGSYRRICPRDPPRRDEDYPRRDDDDGIDPLVVGAGIAVGAALLATWFGQGRGQQANEQPESQMLLENGPQLPMVYPVGSFSVRGFARNGWPVVLDFKPAPRTWTTLDVVFKKRTISMVVDTNGLEGRHLIKLDLPKDGPAKKATPATYVLRSVYLDGRQTNSPRPAPVEVYGIGGGPRAVGSVAIEKLEFQPGMVRVGAPARFDYSAKSPFNRTRAEVLKFVGIDAEQRIQLERVMSTDAANVVVGPHSGQWDGRNQQNGASSLGMHRFQVRAWFTSDDRSWVGAVAPSLVTVSQ